MRIMCCIHLNPVTEEEENDPVIDDIDISTEHISKAEIKTAIMKMKKGKSGGKDALTAEMLKADINTTVDWLENMFKTIWNQEEVPKTWKQELIVRDTKER